jgi:hypothetical protein
VESVFKAAGMTATTATTFVARMNAERVRNGPWSGVLILEGGQEDNKPTDGKSSYT